jgi:hypothetical protein
VVSRDGRSTPPDGCGILVPGDCVSVLSGVKMLTGEVTIVGVFVTMGDVGVMIAGSLGCVTTALDSDEMAVVGAVRGTYAAGSCRAIG